jgi:hypothetical protein
MIVTVLDEPTLLVLADIDEARRQFEPHNVAAGGVTFYDELGAASLRFFPARSDRQFLGILVGDDPGTYELLRPSGA